MRWACQRDAICGDNDNNNIDDDDDDRFFMGVDL
jgi:hypothetical protein